MIVKEKCPHCGNQNLFKLNGMVFCPHCGLILRQRCPECESRLTVDHNELLCTECKLVSSPLLIQCQEESLKN